MRGGSIFYNLNRPSFDNNTYLNNTALYGNNIGSYPVRLLFNSTKENSLMLNDVGSGVEYQGDLTFALVDADDQTMVLDDVSILKMTPITSNSSVTGTDFAKVVNGVGSFQGVTFKSHPGGQNIVYRITSEAISTYFDLTVSFRYCMPGEFLESDGSCSV